VGVNTFILYTPAFSELQSGSSTIVLSSLPSNSQQTSLSIQNRFSRLIQTAPILGSRGTHWSPLSSYHRHSAFNALLVGIYHKCAIEGRLCSYKLLAGLSWKNLFMLQWWVWSSKLREEKNTYSRRKVIRGTWSQSTCKSLQQISNFQAYLSNALLKCVEVL
jgi:hypothetical protein